MTDSATPSSPNSPEPAPARGRLVVVSGPSGVGKSTVTEEVARRGSMQFSISVTTRPARLGEVDGEHYRFIDRERFEAMIDAGELLEWAEYNGNLYGTPLGPVHRHLEEGDDVLLEIDVKGALQVMERHPDAVSVFIDPPSLDELERRLRGRGDTSEGAIRDRMQIAETEMLIGRERFAYVVVNDRLDRVVGEILRILGAPHPQRSHD